MRFEDSVAELRRLRCWRIDASFPPAAFLLDLFVFIKQSLIHV